MKRTILILALALAVISSGCMQGKSGESDANEPAVKEQTTQPIVESADDIRVDDVQLPFIEDNDTVEIGEMI